MDKRVVVTGMGACAPNGVGLENFARAMEAGQSGIRYRPDLAELGFGCQVAGWPEIPEELIASAFSPAQRKGMIASGIIYGILAGREAWEDAGLSLDPEAPPDWASGIVFGAGSLGVDKFREAIGQIDAGQVRRLGSSAVPQTMASGVSAYLGGMLGCGNQVTSNSSACSTGTEGILMGWERIRNGQADRMLCGSCSDSGPYIWGGFDAMRILPRRFNETPEAASRPMSASAAGFVPGSGAAALLLESLESALERGATIYAEVLGGHVNSGGQRNGGSMTAPNSQAVRKCIEQAMQNAGIKADAIDIINGHLTATAWDAEEIENWSLALDRKGSAFPLINSFKGVLGHCLAAAGSLECVAAILQFRQNCCFGNPNTEDLHAVIAEQIGRGRVPQFTVPIRANIIAKASFGFGDVNACIIFKRYTNS